MTQDAIDRWLAAGNEEAMQMLLKGKAGVFIIKGKISGLRLDVPYKPITEEKESL